MPATSAAARDARRRSAWRTKRRDRLSIGRSDGQRALGVGRQLGGVEQRGAQRLRVIEAIVGRFLQAAAHDVDEHARHLAMAVIARDRRRLLVQVHLDRRRLRGAAERRRAREHLEEHDADGVEIGATIDALAARGFGRHVARIAERHAGGGVMLDLPGELRDAEVDQFDELGIAAATNEHDVAGAHVAMHDAVRVCGGERVAQLRGDARGACGRQARGAIEHAPQIVAGEILHHVGDALSARLEDEVVDLDEVLAAELGDGARFAEEARHRFVVEREVRAQELDGGSAPELVVAAEVDLRRRAAAEAPLEAVAADERAGEVAGERLGAHGASVVQRLCHANVAEAAR